MKRKLLALIRLFSAGFARRVTFSLAGRAVPATLIAIFSVAAVAGFVLAIANKPATNGNLENESSQDVVKNRTEVHDSKKPQQETLNLADYRGAKKNRFHSADWLQNHQTDAKNEPSKCLFCHAEQFCISCHQGNVPKSHSSGKWGTSHGSQAGQKQCRTCHKPAFCMSCHETQKPVSHNKEWKKQHSRVANGNGDLCDNCHGIQSCKTCHGISMPHPTDWLSKMHQLSANGDSKVCEKCHTDDYCAKCHRSSKPASHGPRWLIEHGKANGNCDICHDKSMCDKCHGAGKIAKLPEGHENPDWLKTHGKGVKTDISSCTGCHDKKSYCDACHGTEMPHPKGWIIGHKDKNPTFEPNGVCMKCHEREKSCRCHGPG